MRVAAALVLGALLLSASLLMDPRGYLGTDTGGKVATLEVMVATGSWAPDVGYWAEEHDPEGRFHPLYFTSQVGEHWVNVTTLPMLLAARPLYEVGGYRLALLLPVAGAVAAAFAARALAERVRQGGGWWAFWLVGLASPMTVYALDFWEHTWGAALMAWAVVLLLELGRRRLVVEGLLVGMLFGAAATMRTEALAVGAVAVAVVALELLWRNRGLGEPLLFGAGAVAGVTLMGLANSLLELWVLGSPYRADRAASAAGSGGWELGSRLQEAGVTTVGVIATFDVGMLLFGVALLLGLVWLALDRKVETGILALLVVLVLAGYGVRIWMGLGFVPGLVPATPLAVLGVVRCWRVRRARRLLLIALCSLPVVWAFQYTGGATPQWGGRYLLAPGLVLMALGVAALGQLDVVRRAVFVGAAVLVTVLGVSWAVVRSHDVARSGEQLLARSDVPVISDRAFWLRELGAYYRPDLPWMTAQGELQAAVEVLGRAGLSELKILHTHSVEAPAISGYRAGQTVQVSGFRGESYGLTRYSAE